MRSPVLFLVPAVLLSVAIPPSEAKKVKYLACSDRYVVTSGASKIVADSAPDPVILSIQGKQVGIGHCAPRAASVKASKKGTTVAATWKGCDAALKKVHLTAKSTDCITLTGSVSAKKVPKETFAATRSVCGDGVVDPGRGESCDGSQGCSQGETCGSDCACHVSTTTTVPSVSTTVTTITETPSTTTSTTLIGHCTQSGAQCTTERDDCPPTDPSKCGGSVTSGCQGCCGNGENEPGETCDKGPDNCPTTDLPCSSGCTADCRAVGECTVTRAQCLTNADCSGGPAGQTCCGNGIVESGETCDDGNTVDGDSCPASCHVDPCVPVPGTLAASVRYAGPAGTTISGLGLFVDYPAGKVTSPSVTAGFGVSQTDTQYGYGFNDEALKLGGLPATFLHITFQQLCQGAPPATAADFKCTVNDASDDAGNVVSASQVTCTVTVP